MSDVTFVACRQCHAEGEVELPHCGAEGPLLCPVCQDLVSMIDVTPWQTHIEQRVAHFADRQRSGQLGTRKQALMLSDPTLNRDGLAAELAACLLLCPGMRHQWLSATGPNRGNDLPREWTLLPQPVEVKQTRYCDEWRGCLIVRPPRQTPGPMRLDYIDDCYYVLMHGERGLFTLLGWADRSHLLSAGELNPIPVRQGQRECWGLHWQRLRPPHSLLKLLPRDIRR